MTAQAGHLQGQSKNADLRLVFEDFQLGFPSAMNIQKLNEKGLGWNGWSYYQRVGRLSM